MAVSPTTTSGSETFQCVKCEELKDLDEFVSYFYKGKLMHRNDCKDCQKKYNKEHHKLIMSVPVYADKRLESLQRSRDKYYQTHKHEPEFRAARRAKDKRYRKRLKGHHFLEIAPIIPVAREFINLYGIECLTDITGYSSDFFHKMFNNEYTVIRADVADTILTRLNGPAFACLYHKKKRYFLDTGKDKYLGRNIEL